MMTRARAASIILSLFATSALAGHAWATPVPMGDAQLSHVVAGEDFNIVNEVADQASAGAHTTDPLLINPWGLSQAPGGPLWVANNETSTSTLYNASFDKIPLTVIIPGVNGDESNPTGTVFTSFGGNSFRITAHGVTAHSLFLFDSQDGAISGWAPSVDLTHAVIAVDMSAEGAVFTGLTLTHLGAAPQLFAADFANNRIDVFNNQFHQTASFTDTSLPEGYAPFNVQTLNGKVYIAYALRDEDNDEVAGAGLGFVDVFDTHGHKLQTLISHGALNAPWGLTIAPASFGRFAGALLVGNFGDGKVNAFDPKTGAFLGTLSSGGDPLFIDGLWALRNGADGTVVFSAGPDDESHGLVGVIRPSWSAASWAFQSHVKLGH